MKKKLFLAAGAAAILASCSTEEIVEINDDSNAICFNASVNHSTDSRGIESSTELLNSFYVSAFINEKLSEYDIRKTLLLTNTLFTKQGGSFKTANSYHWSHEMKLDIYAYGYCSKDKSTLPADVNASELKCCEDGVYVTPEQMTIYKFSPAKKIEDQIDFIFAKAIDAKQPAMGGALSLSFNHMLSEISVDARCDSKSHRVKVAGLKYGNILSKADFNFNMENPEWTLAKDITTYEVTRFEEPIILGNVKADLSNVSSNGYAILLPQGLSTFNSDSQYFGYKIPDSRKTQATCQYIAVLCRIEVLDYDPYSDPNNNNGVKFPFRDEYKEVEINGEYYGWAYIPIHTDQVPAWKMGNRYQYHLDFSEGAGYNPGGDNIIEGEIAFTANVSAWTNNDVDYIGKPGGK